MKVSHVGFSALILAVLGCQPVIAEESETLQTPAPDKQRNSVIYGGIGSAEDGSFNQNGDTPWSVGIYGGQKYIFGLEIAGEGTKLDSTSGLNDYPGQALSFNGIVGAKLIKNEDFKVDVGALLGVREGTESCPDGQSYLGFQCYADSNSSVSYEFSYGAILTLSYKAGLIGVRATGESTQVLLGVRF